MLRSPAVRWVLFGVSGLLVWFALIGVAEGRVAKSVGTRIEQCENGVSGIADCTGKAWTTGDLNAQHSSYSEGDFVPFRTVITGLTAGTHYTLRIGYDAVEKGLHAYDYLGSYDASEAPGQQVVPCDGVAGTAPPHACGTGTVPGSPSTLAVPTDSNTHFPSGSQRPGVFSAWGGELTAASYVSPTSTIDVNTTGTVEREIDVTFTADGNTVVLAWGGHLASNLDWGVGETFLGNHSGASFHMRLKSINGASTGNQDLSIHGDVLAPAPTISTAATPTSVVVGNPVIDVASLSGASVAPAGTVAFFVCFDAGAAPDCSAGGTRVGQSQVIISRSRARHRRRHRPPARRRRAASAGFASASYTPGSPGFYCFRAEYTPAAGVPYSPWSHTDVTKECFEAITPPATLSVTKICVPTDDAGRFNLLIDDVVALDDATCGAATAPITEPPGSHTVGETAGTGTNLTDYTATIGGDCASDGSLTLAAGEAATCTITNVRNGEQSATLTVNKVCQPAGDSGRFDVHIDALVVPDVACGDSTGPITLPAGPHTVSEQGGTNTSLADYTSVIGGDCAPDGSIALAADQSATCTITNTRKPPPPATITVDKACLPASDDGHFNLTIDGDTAGGGADVGCGGSTGAVVVHPGLHSVGETAAGGTDLDDYRAVIGGDCATDGTVLVPRGDQATCTITNVRKPQPFAILTVDKVCVPAGDGGLFNLSIGQRVEANVPCGGSLGPVAVPVGAHLVAETAGTGTDLADYTATIGGACAADGSITLAAGQSAICTITNVRKLPPPTPPTATIAVKKQCVPATVKHRFTLRLDQQALPAMTCGESTGPMQVSTGRHVVGELRAGIQPAAFRTVIGGDCAANGSIILAAGQHATCTVTNIHKRPPSPPPSPTICNTLSATPRTLAVGLHGTILARVRARGKPVLGAQVTLVGHGTFKRRFTPASGVVHFTITPPRAGVLRLRTQRQFGCRRAAKGVVAAIRRKRRPRVTG